MIILCSFVSLGIKAQYDASFSHYFDMEPSFNPASVGKYDKLNINAAYAMDMAGFEHNPQTMYAAADIPFYFMKAYNGAGVQFMNDKIGLFTHKRLALQYAYKHKLFKGIISIGAQVGIISEDFEGDKADLDETSDPAFSTAQLNGNGVDLALGAYYIRKQWYAGVSAQHINSPLIKLGGTNELKIDPTYYLTGGYNIKLNNPFVTIKPSILLRADGTTYRADITSRFVYSHDDKMMYGGFSYSPTNSVTFLIGGTFHGLVLGYSYEVYTSAINPENGSHELFVGYQTDINLVKKGKNKHKNVRIL